MRLPVASGLADRLKRETADLHTQAERAGVMGDLLRGRIGRDAYCALLRNLHAIYEELERSLDANASDGWVRALWQPALRRAAALAQDLDALRGGDWRRDIALEAAAERYVARLRELASGRSLDLVAHAYVRYLGDLNGGQTLSRIVRGRFALPDEAGLRFYAFGGSDEVQRLRAAFRQELARMVLDPASIERIVAEARWAFEQHRLLFDELQTRHPPTSA